MGSFGTNEGTLEGDIYIQKLSKYIKRNEEHLANGLLMFSRNKPVSSKSKPSRLSISLHHLYYILEKIDTSSLGVDIGPLNIRLDNPNHEPTFISFMANNARSSKHFDSDAKSISSMSSMKSIVSNASMYWRSFNGTIPKDPKSIIKDIKYLYSSFTKLPCLVLTPNTNINAITGYEEYPCDTAVPMRMFKNLQVLELIDYDPNEIFGWHTLSEQLRILIIRGSKINDLTEFLYHLVVEDETGRSSFNSIKTVRRSNTNHDVEDTNDHNYIYSSNNNNAFKYPSRQKSYTSNITSQTQVTLNSSNGAGSSFKDQDFDTHSSNKENNLGDNKWLLLRQLSIVDTSITSVQALAFKPLTNLVKLNLSNNLLESIPEGLEHLSHIKYINLSDNYITCLKGLPSNLKHLTTLNLNHNKIKSLKGLENLYTLEKLDLRRNLLDSIDSLKPILYLFININEKFNNIYLNDNKLPKNYRIDLFNLVNGIKYANKFMIDDSRPGYFESALLLDNEASTRNLHNFFNTNSTSRDSLDFVNSLSKLNLHDDTKPFIPLSNKNLTNLSDLSKISELGKLKKSTTLNSISDAKNNPTSVVTQVQVTARMST